MSEWTEYYNSVFEDIVELKQYYPFVNVYYPPTIVPQLISIKVLAVGIDIVEETHATEKDFAGEYSKELFITIPIEYKKRGCKVYGGKWIRRDLIPEKHHHFNGADNKGNNLLCVGIPESFQHMKNVILENVRTADMMLVFYEAYQTGKPSSLQLLEYSHGTRGIDEYKRKKQKYKTKQND